MTVPGKTYLGLLVCIWLMAATVTPASSRFFVQHPFNTGAYNSCLIQDRNGAIWFGTQAGINRLDRATGKFTRFLHVPGDVNSRSHDSVWTVTAGKDGVIWIGTESGLDALSPETNQVTRFSHDPASPSSRGRGRVYAVLEDEWPFVWVGTSLGGLNISRINPAAWSKTQFSASPKTGTACPG